jgi:hypothetical protein
LHTHTSTISTNINNSNNSRNTSTTSTKYCGNSNFNNTHNINISVHNSRLFPCFDRPLQADQDLFLSKANMYLNALPQQSLGLYLGYCSISHQSLGSAMHYGQANHVYHPALAALSMSGPFTQNKSQPHDLGFLYRNLQFGAKVFKTNNGLSHSSWL